MGESLLSNHGRRILLAGTLFWVLTNACVVILETRFPGTDIFLFKEAGVNLAQKGKLIVANISHITPDVEVPFAYYPPVYPFLFGIWVKVFGVGLKQSLAFECVFRGLRSLLIGWLLWPWLKKGLARKSFCAKSGFVICLLLLSSLVSTDNDRPDEAAIVFGLLSWAILLRSTSKWRSIFSGLILGVSAGTSPAAGFFFGLGGAALALSRRKVAEFIVIGVSSLLMFILINLPVHWANPAATFRFSVQAGKSSFPYLIPFYKDATLSDFFRTFWKALRQSFVPGWPYFCCLFLLLFPAFWNPNGKKFHQDLGEHRVLLVVSLSFVPFSLLVWSLQPYYLWFSCIGIALISLLRLLKSTQGSESILRGLILLFAFTPLLIREGKGGINALQRLSTPDLNEIRERILSRVKPGERIAVTFDQFYTFRQHRVVADLHLICANLDRFDYAYVTRIHSSHRNVSPIPIPCEEKKHCFSMVEDLTTSKLIRLLGSETPYYVRGHGGVLFQNTKCRGSIP